MVVRVEETHEQPPLWSTRTLLGGLLLVALAVLVAVALSLRTGPFTVAAGIAYAFVFAATLLVLLPMHDETDHRS
jgi:Mg/Co/Ni transporter MgtE